MEYVKLYTRLLTHPKARKLSDRAWRTLTLAWCYAGEHETGGRFEDDPPLLRSTPKVLAELEDAGWIHKNGTGYVLNDWDEHQEALDEISEVKRKAREKKAAQRARWRAESRDRSP